MFGTHTDSSTETSTAVRSLIQWSTYVIFWGTERLGVLLWPIRQPEQMPFDYFFADSKATFVKTKHTHTHTHTGDGLQKIIWCAVSAIYRQKFQTVTNDRTTTRHVYLIVAGRHL